MRKKISLLFMTTGMMCILLATGVLIYTQLQERAAASFSHEVVVAFGQEMTETEIRPDEATKMIGIEHEKYMGILLLPGIEIELPVADGFSDDSLKQTPCVFSGGIETNDLIIAAHNYEAHFGKLDQVKLGEKVYLLDALGELHTYLAVDKEIIGGTELDKLYAGKWDMTLFTCFHMNNAKRLIVRFEKEEDVHTKEINMERNIITAHEVVGKKNVETEREMYLEEDLMSTYIDIIHLIDYWFPISSMIL